jgi:hypothetical protein
MAKKNKKIRNSLFALLNRKFLIVLKNWCNFTLL